VGKRIVAKLKAFWLWLVSKFFPRYTLKVSYNDTWGDSDDQEYIVKKFYKKTPKFLKFKTHEGDLVEISGAEGLNWRVEEL
jgi:hypothetical protein|tara:strand:- start:83 stop:325 length:243 start_codon:yes stop_codon:yes gene_type:complete